jgi:hypothetical protein
MLCAHVVSPAAGHATWQLTCLVFSLIQSIVDGFQHEQPDYWLNFGNPWEIERLNVAYPIKFYGHVSVAEEDGRQKFRWNASETVRQHMCPCGCMWHSSLIWCLAVGLRSRSLRRRT